MNKLFKYILSATIISLLSVLLISKTSFAFNVPALPKTIDSNSIPGVPTVPPVPTKSEVPTVPPLPTSVCCGVSPTQAPSFNPTATTVPNQPGNGGGTGGVNTNPPSSNNDSGTGGADNSTGSQVLGYSATSGNTTVEIIALVLGLFLASYGFKKIISKKI